MKELGVWGQKHKMIQAPNQRSLASYYRQRENDLYSDYHRIPPTQICCKTRLQDAHVAMMAAARMLEMVSSCVIRLIQNRLYDQAMLPYIKKQYIHVINEDTSRRRSHSISGRVHWWFIVQLLQEYDIVAQEVPHLHKLRTLSGGMRSSGMDEMRSDSAMGDAKSAWLVIAHLDSGS